MTAHRNIPVKKLVTPPRTHTHTHTHTLSRLFLAAKKTQPVEGGGSSAVTRELKYTG